MDLTVDIQRQNTKRLKKLKLESNTLDEERFLHSLYRVINEGGSVACCVTGEEELVCDFEGENGDGAFL